MVVALTMDTEETQSNSNELPTTETAATAAADAGTTASTEASPREAGTGTDRTKADAAKAADYWDRLLRVTADFDNYKKRVARERQDAAKYAFLPLLEKLIPVLDHFEIALNTSAGNAGAAAPAAFQEGMAMIYQQLRSALTESGLEEINALGQPFDPNFHEAVSQQPTADVPEGQVTMQLRKGYRYRDRLVRPASVVVAKAPEPTPAATVAAGVSPS